VGLGLLACALVVLVVMGLGPKKQDRYALPAVPLLGLVAAVGYRRALPAIRRPPGRALALGGVGLAQLALCAASRPYYLTYYSPLLGGPAVARQVLLIGWGEGLDPVAAFLNALPRRPRPDVAAPSTVHAALQAQTHARILDPDEKGASRADYAVRYVSADPRGEVPPLGDARLVLEVRVNGLEYARLYARQ
jgi:hypothetical protein